MTLPGVRHSLKVELATVSLRLDISATPGNRYFYSRQQKAKRVLTSGKRHKKTPDVDGGSPPWDGVTSTVKTDYAQSGVFVKGYFCPGMSFSFMNTLVSPSLRAWSEETFDSTRWMLFFGERDMF